MTGFAKRGLIHASNVLNLRLCNSACVGPTDLKFGRRIVLLLYYTYRMEQCSLIACLQIKLCLFKVEKLDVCIRPLFPNLVTYIYGLFELGVLLKFFNC